MTSAESTADPEVFMRADDVARYLGVSRRFVYKFLETGELSFHKIGTAKVIPKSEVD